MIIICDICNENITGNYENHTCSLDTIREYVKQLEEQRRKSANRCSDL